MLTKSVVMMSWWWYDLGENLKVGPREIKTWTPRILLYFFKVLLNVLTWRKAWAYGQGGTKLRCSTIPGGPVETFFTGPLKIFKGPPLSNTFSGLYGMVLLGQFQWDHGKGVHCWDIFLGGSVCICDLEGWRLTLVCWSSSLYWDSLAVGWVESLEGPLRRNDPWYCRGWFW
jgi:hypothetical protein